MKKAESIEFERELSRRGWQFDVDDEEFRDGERLLSWEDVIGLIPGLSLDDLRAWEEDKVDRHCARRRARG